MDQSYTNDLLIKYIYSETDIAEKFEIENAIENDSTLNRAFLRLYFAYKSLPKVLFRPSERVINNLLLFSRTCVS